MGRRSVISALVGGSILAAPLAAEAQQVTLGLTIPKSVLVRADELIQ
jgi:sRNA-binding carbon storage regulator CsrA